MDAQSIGFVGSGRVARIMVEGWRREHALPLRIVASDATPAATAALRDIEPRVLAADNCSAASQGIVFLALHPPALVAAAPEIAASLRPDALVVSLAPKVTIARLSALLGGFARIARLIPNAPSIVGSGFNPIAFGDAIPAADRDALLALLAPLGESPIVEERTLEPYAITAAMGPTYLWFQLFELRKIASRLGLTRADAAVAVDHMVRGALDTMEKSGLSDAQVMDLVPVHPLDDVEPGLLEAYRTRLASVAERIRPA